MSADEVNYFGANPHLGDAVERINSESESKRAQEDVPIPEMFANGVPRSYTVDTLPRDAWVEVDLGAIAHNVKVAHRHLGPRRHLLAVVKADGYGHGAVQVARTALASGADHLAVSTVEEGIELRQAGIDAPILILSQPPMRSIPLLLAFNIMPTVTTSEFALALGEAADLHGMVAKYHLGVDTGMNRIGVFYLDVVDFMQSINFHRGLQLDGMFTHFATADEDSDWDFRMQLERFNQAIQLMTNARIDPGIIHCANSASIQRYPEAYFDMGRVGITMYGLAPSPVLRGVDGLIPAMQVKCRISYLKEPQLGEGVSYGLNYRVAKPVQIATVPLGYADGVRRELSGKMKVLCNGRPCLQVGNICMDQMMIEIPIGHSVRGVKGGAEIGDEVVLIGRQNGLEVTADKLEHEHLAGAEVRSHKTLDEALEGVFSCHKCALGDTRTNVVPGDGNPHAKVMFIGEAPGRNEALQGKPFVGAAGKLLDQLLDRIHLNREDIYIANILKCRPPRNRDPRPDEIVVCTPWLREQIKAIHPTVLVTMGNFSTKFILQTQTGITRLRGSVHVTGPFRVIPTFHPAAAIYDRNKIPYLENDFDLIRGLLDSDAEYERKRAASQGDGEGGA